MAEQQHSMQHHPGHPYLMFALNMGISLVIMYFVMFSMIDGWHDFRNNVNMLYMALTMVAPMGVIMLVTMPRVYANKRVNIALYVGLAVLFLLAFVATRNQSLIHDRQFVLSMVPHHSGAILMCRQAELTDPELRKLCDRITSSQRSEIEQMNVIKARLDGKT